MNPVDALFAALRALKANVLRSVLTTLGIIIGVGAVIVMISVGAGAEARMDQLISSLGSNLLMIIPGTSTLGGVRLGHGSRPTITEEDAQAIQREISTVQVAAPIVRGSGQVVFGNQNWGTTVYGVTPEYFIAREWEITSGRDFTPEDLKGAAKVVLLGETVIKNLFPGQDPLGQEIRIKRVPFTVIGVLKEKGETPMGQDQDDAVLIPLPTAWKRVLGGRFLSGRGVNAIFVKVRDSGEVAGTSQEVKDLLRQRHHLKSGDEDDFVIRNLSQILETRAESSRAMAVLLAAVASISLVVGGIGIMNIMLVSVTERTREIGLRMAVGARRRDILAQFLIEAVTLSLIGGAMGVILGLMGSVSIARWGEWPTVIEAESIALAFGFAAAVGVFFGYYPARKAARLNPIEALRYE
ncbi:MAG: putative transport system permease protein [Thermodesulfobacteriota bacterium]|nr:putative transport system permease protein [Thermodesulfobacteriota bacterium]